MNDDLIWHKSAYGRKCFIKVVECNHRHWYCGYVEVLPSDDKIYKAAQNKNYFKAEQMLRVKTNDIPELTYAGDLVWAGVQFGPFIGFDTENPFFETSLEDTIHDVKCLAKALEAN